MWPRRLFSSVKAIRVDDHDISDFRLRVWKHLSKTGRPVAPLSDHDRIRMTELEQERKDEWKLMDKSMDRTLGGIAHVEKDKQIVRDLLDHAVQKNPKHRVNEMFRAIASPILSSPSVSQTDCFQLLIDLGVITQDTNPCVLRHEQPLFFSPQVLAEVPKIVHKHETGFDPERSIREDLRSHIVFTIDAPNATEIDDAVGLWTDSLGQLWVMIHVADPTRLIEPRSLMDSYAQRRGVSVFLPERHFPMICNSISSTVFSINPGKETHTMTFAARLAKDGSVLERRIFPSIVQNVCKISYKQADDVLRKRSPDGISVSAEQEKMLFALSEVSKSRRSFRESRGAIIMDVPEAQVVVRGRQIQVFKSEARSSSSRSLIEELMILAGQIAAEHCKEHMIPVPFRVQNRGNVSKLIGPSTAASMTEEAKLLQALTLSEMHGAAYMDVSPKRHYSVGLDAYTQVTSPIRRYPDMLVAHQIKAHARQSTLPFSSWDILQFRDMYESVVRQVETLQSNSIRYWIMRHMTSDEFKAKHPNGQLKVLILPKWLVVSSSAPSSAVVRNSSAQEFVAGDAVPVFVLDYSLRAHMKLKNDHRVGDVITVSIQRIDYLKLEIDLQEV